MPQKGTLTLVLIHKLTRCSLGSYTIALSEYFYPWILFYSVFRTYPYPRTTESTLTTAHLYPALNHTFSFMAQQELRLPPLLLLLLLLLAAATQRQAHGLSATQYLWGVCGSNTYLRNSTFALNLNTVVGVLTQKAAAGEPFYLTNATQGSDNSSWAYGGYQCRGDLSAENCSSCVNSATGYSCSRNNGAGYAFGMRVQLLGCYYRFEGSAYSLTATEFNEFDHNCSAAQNTDPQYQSNLTTALKTTVSAAPSNYRYFSASTIGSAHALSQCFSFLSPSDCSTCLNQSSSRAAICDTSSSGYFLYGSCYYLFSDTNLLFSESTAPSPPPPPSSGSPPMSPPPPPPSSGSPPRSPPPPPSSPLWFPPGNYISPTATNAPAPESHAGGGLSAAAIAGISAVAAIAGCVAIVVCVVCCIKRRNSTATPQAAAGPRSMLRSPAPAAATEGLKLGGYDPSTAGSGKYPSIFTVDELQVATENFHVRNKIGQGGFGAVYKGTLENGKMVAVKVIAKSSASNVTVNGGDVDFTNEAKLITTVQHRNLIQLFGCVADDSQWYLVYEYLPNRSLDLHLFGSRTHEDLIELDWKTRFNIISGTARGLIYLHEESHVRIVHRDIKASNILLDGNLQPKIADFGVARLFPDQVASYLIASIAGTVGYIAPEYVLEGQLSEKVDVYSFGVVTLEIVSGRRVIGNVNVNNVGQTIHILEWAWGLYERKQTAEIVDRRIRSSANYWEVERVVHVALLCTQSNPQARPSMSEVYVMLHSQSAILPLPSRPRIMSGPPPPPPPAAAAASAASGRRPTYRQRHTNYDNESSASTITSSGGGRVETGYSSLSSWVTETDSRSRDLMSEIRPR